MFNKDNYSLNKDNYFNLSSDETLDTFKETFLEENAENKFCTSISSFNNFIKTIITLNLPNVMINQDTSFSQSISILTKLLIPLDSNKISDAKVI